jgi:hypothetical protein
MSSQQAFLHPTQGRVRGLQFFLCLVPGAWGLGSGAWSLAPGVWGLFLRKAQGPRISLDDWCSLLGRRDAWWQFQDPNVAKVDFRAFRLQAQVAFADRRIADGIHEFAID